MKSSPRIWIFLFSKENDMQKASLTLLVFTLMNFVLAMTAFVFNGILDKVAVSLNILAAVLVVACAATPTSPLPTVVTPTLTSPPTVASPPPTNPPPTTAATAAPPEEISPEMSASEMSARMKIRITVEGAELTATLIDSPTTRDFISLLPLTITLEDYGKTEKISYLPRKLSTQAAPAGIDPAVGDLTYYAPWGNLAIFIHDFGYSNGLVLLGKIDGDMSALNVSGPVKVTIELAE